MWNETDQNQINEMDVLGRLDKLQELRSIIMQYSQKKESASFAIDGSWGAGKSYMISNLIECLKDEQVEESSSDRFLILNYNAWKYEYYEEPFEAIINVFYDTINNSENNILNELYNVLKESSIQLISSKSGLDLKKIYRQRKTHTNDHLFTLEALLKNIQNQLAKVSLQTTILVFVDELDRCVPSYAIKVMERLLHFFEGVKNIIIVYAIDSNHLSYSITQIYGDINVNLFLKKFINYKYQIDIGAYLPSFCQRNPNFFEMFNYCPESICELLNYSGLDIRSVEKIIEKAIAINRNLPGMYREQEHDDKSQVEYDISEDDILLDDYDESILADVKPYEAVYSYQLEEEVLYFELILLILRTRMNSFDNINDAEYRHLKNFRWVDQMSKSHEASLSRIIGSDFSAFLLKKSDELRNRILMNNGKKILKSEDSFDLALFFFSNVFQYKEAKIEYYNPGELDYGIEVCRKIEEKCRIFY